MIFEFWVNYKALHYHSHMAKMYTWTVSSLPRPAYCRRSTSPPCSVKVKVIKPHTIKHTGSINVDLQGRVPVKLATEREQGQEGDQEQENKKKNTAD